MSNYDAEILAIVIALAELINHKDSFLKPVILVDSSSASQVRTGNRNKETLILSMVLFEQFTT